MIAHQDLKAIARGRLREARVLFDAGRYDGAVYLAGYAVELTLKARICRTLRWSGFPETASEFQGFLSIRTHSLPILLRFSGAESRITTNYVEEWSIVLDWSPQKRYQVLGKSTLQDASEMIASAQTLLGVL